ncbi:hypothetical protein [Desulfurobacterium indicum]|uniref:Uncharacterized protein n=1 Tax=Desulfurobacterium indicum TaxID=1914305 RepID=A0A1R1MNH6_9BACT|nr:hypothetical protein [Desulfurobacterium indicum]OMH41368.1 hypothetical protein BLW93_00320 [Desulfurobacterium indicum]
MELEEILFGLIGTGGSWQIYLRMPDGKGVISIKNGLIISVKYSTPFDDFSGERALKEIIKVTDVVQSMDLQPLKGDVEENLSCDFSKLMSIFESLQIEKEAVQEVMDNLSKIKSEKKPLVSNFNDLLNTCARIFSEGTIDAILFFDKDGIFKIEGRIDNVSIDLKEPFQNFAEVISDICQDRFIDIIVNMGAKFIYAVYNLDSRSAIMAVVDEREKANFELDQDEIKEAFISTLMKI